mgnify:CR=1 FL=1
MCYFDVGQLKSIVSTVALRLCAVIASAAADSELVAIASKVKSLSTETDDTL